MSSAIPLQDSAGSLISDWHSPRDLNRLVTRATPGDLIEMGRGLYSHWAVYAGLRLYNHEQEPCVFHCGSDPRFHVGNVLCCCMSFRKRVHGIGAVAMEPLADVCGRSHARINNKRDNKWTALEPVAIIARAERKNHDQEEYDFLMNNCEHFATWCRYGIKESKQPRRNCFGLFRCVGTYVPTLGGLSVALTQLSQTPRCCVMGKPLLDSEEATEANRISDTVT